MARPRNKTDLVSAVNDNYKKLNNIIDSLADQELSIPFNFENDPKKTEAHWKRDKNVRDVLVHLYEWHNLLINWIDKNTNGDLKPFIPEPYNWKTYGDMNVSFWEKHQTTSFEEARDMFAKSHDVIMNLIDEYSNNELFTKNVYPWVGGSVLGSYFVSVTSSHYDWAMKKIKAHVKNCKIL